MRLEVYISLHLNFGPFLQRLWRQRRASRASCLENIVIDSTDATWRLENTGMHCSRATGRLETAGRLKNVGSEATWRQNAGFEATWRFQASRALASKTLDWPRFRSCFGSSGFEATWRLETAERLDNAGFEESWRFEVSRTVSLASKHWIRNHSAPSMDIHGSTQYIYIHI